MAAPPGALPPGASERRVEFSNAKGEVLVGTLVDTGAAGVALICHGYMANKDMCKFPALAAALAAAGVSSLRFDHACAWRGESQRAGPFLMGNHEDEVQDMQAASSFLRDQGRRVLALVGHSKGGTNVLRHAALVGDIPRVVWLAGRFRVRDGTLARVSRHTGVCAAPAVHFVELPVQNEAWPAGRRASAAPPTNRLPACLPPQFGADILDRLAVEKSILRCEADGFEWTMTEADFVERATTDTVGYAAAVKAGGRVALLCVHGRGDRTIPFQESEECAAAAGAQLAIVDGDHNWTRPADAAQMIAAVVEFVTKP